VRRQSATLIKNGAQMAIDEANAKGTIPGYKIETIRARQRHGDRRQYDPAQAATNTKAGFQHRRCRQCRAVNER